MEWNLFRKDYRVILRRFEFECYLTRPAGQRSWFGGGYSHLLDDFYATDARRLPKTFRSLNEAQRTLYVLLALGGQVDNGGSSQYCFNVEAWLQDEAAAALERIGAAEASRRFARVVEAARGDKALAETRAEATDWGGYLAYKSELSGKGSAHAEFDDWWFAGQDQELDRLLLDYVRDRADELARFCDGVARLEARWARRLLGELAETFDTYEEALARDQPYDFFDLLFTPERRERLGATKEERRNNARAVATRLMPAIRQAARRPGLATYSAEPAPRLAIGDRRGRGEGRATIAAVVDGYDVTWHISGWE